MCKGDAENLKSLFQMGKFDRKFAEVNISQSIRVFRQHFMITPMARAAELTQDDVNAIAKNTCERLMKIAQWKLEWGNAGGALGTMQTIGDVLCGGICNLSQDEGFLNSYFSLKERINNTMRKNRAEFGFANTLEWSNRHLPAARVED